MNTRAQTIAYMAASLFSSCGNIESAVIIAERIYEESWRREEARMAEAAKRAEAFQLDQHKLKK